MNKKVLLVILLMIVIQSASAVIFVGDGTVDYVITDGLVIAGGTVTIADGADISGTQDTTGDATVENRGRLNINGGIIRGYVHSLFESNGLEVNMTGGHVAAMYLYGGDHAISGGIVDYITSETSTFLDITGGHIGGIYTFFGSEYEIDGGVFTGRVVAGNPAYATISIRGGEYQDGFSYEYSDDDTGPNLIFYGDLSLTTPVPVPGGYQSMIVGTLEDGSPLSQPVICYDASCSGIEIVDATPATNVMVEIKPIKKSSGIIDLKKDKNIRVAISGTDTFDALQVDVETVRFGPDRARPVRYKGRDINRDGFSDLLLTFKLEETGIICGDTGAMLSAQTTTAPVVSIAGRDTFSVEPCF